MFVNHRPNIDLLTMELINIGDLLVGSISEAGEIEVLGTIRVDMPGANGTGTGEAK